MKLRNLAIAATLWATTAAAQTTIVGSPHDLSPTGASVKISSAANAQGQVCVFCHLPHGASYAGAPLWNRGNATTAFTMYSSANSATFVTNTPGENTATRAAGAVSLACLSCHDGVTAFNSLNSAPMFDTDAGATAANYTFASGAKAVVTMSDVATPGAGSPLIGTDLTNDHPISFTYDTALATTKSGGTAGATGGLKDPATALSDAVGPLAYYRAGTTNKTIAAQMLFTEGTAVNQLECASCHEPHIHGASGAGNEATNFPFLIKSNQASQLCLTCHVK
jgi:nitrate/TMAO reductase-like tetraheme cytochrome c subunit